MWSTPSGPRYLRGSHAELFNKAAEVLADAARDDWTFADNEGWGPGPEPYSKMSARQQLVCLAAVCPHVLSPSPKTPPVTAWAESVIEAVYYEVYRLIDEMEISGGMGRRWRHLTHKAHAEEFDWRFEPTPRKNSRHRESWLEMTQRLAGRLLWPGPTGEDYHEHAPRPTTARVETSLVLLERLTQGRLAA